MFVSSTLFIFFSFNLLLGEKDLNTAVVFRQQQALSGTGTAQHTRYQQNPVTHNFKWFPHVHVYVYVYVWVSIYVTLLFVRTPSFSLNFFLPLLLLRNHHFHNLFWTFMSPLGVILLRKFRDKTIFFPFHLHLLC